MTAVYATTNGNSVPYTSVYSASTSGVIAECVDQGLAASVQTQAGTGSVRTWLLYDALYGCICTHVL